MRAAAYRLDIAGVRATMTPPTPMPASVHFQESSE
jgi:hypothetical protein